LGFAPDAKLIAHGDDFTIAEIDFEQLLAHGAFAVFVFEHRNDATGFGFDHVAGRGISKLAIDAEGDPSGFKFEGDFGDVFGRGCSRVEYLHGFAGGIGDPNFAFIGREADAVAGAAVFASAAFAAGDFDAMELFARAQIADFEAAQAIDVDVTEGCAGVDGEGSNRGSEWAYFAFNGVIAGVDNGQLVVFERRQVGMSAVEAAEGVVGAVAHFNALDDVAVGGVDHFPIRAVDGRHINCLSVRRHGHAVATFVVSAFPQELFGCQIEAPELLRRADVNAERCRAAAEALGLRAKIRGRKAPYELVFRVDVKDKDAGCATAIISAGHGDVEKSLFGSGNGSRENEKKREGKNSGHSGTMKKSKTIVQPAVVVDRCEALVAKLVQPGERVVVGVSGGVDSMVLLHLLQRQSLRLTIAHLNHQLRGRSSDADQKLVERMARELKVALVCERVDVRAVAAKEKLSIEMAARQVRHEFLARVAREHRIKMIALAHHADDQVELFFLRLFRGAGTDGLSGMEPVAASPADPGVRIVRPLLSMTRAEIADYARREGIPFREDASNRSVDHARNRIRHELLPLLERKFQPAIRQVVLRTMELLSADADFSWHAALDWLGRNPCDFEMLHLAVQRRVVQDQLIELGIAPDFFLIERLRREPQQLVCVAPGKLLLRDLNGRLQVKEDVRFDFHQDQLEIDLRSKQRSVDFDGVKLSWKLKEVKAPSVSRRAGAEQFDADAIGPQFVLRHWQKGDRFQPIGLPSAVKVQDLFANAKIAKAQRHERVIAATAGGEIFWVEGLRMAERFKLRPETRRVLEWSWERRDTNSQSSRESKQRGSFPRRR
jgi:tRNA(Ile)-lysidine synthase